MARQRSNIRKRDALKARKAHHERLLRLPNVQGTMIGRKIVGGQRTDEMSVMVVVNRKRKQQHLKTQELIPKSLKVDGVRVKTDVIRLSRVHWQAWQGPVYCTDLIHNGTVTAFCDTPGGLIGLSCAHVLEGADRLPNIPSPITLRDASGRDLEVGETIDARVSKGTGTSDAFGFLDVAYFSLKEAWAVKETQTMSPLAVAKSSSGKLSANTFRGALAGEVIGEQLAWDGWYCDYVIQAADPGTYGGDSGMLWRNRVGEAVAIHAAGSDKIRGGGTRVSLAMDIRRALAALHLDASSLLATP